MIQWIDNRHDLFHIIVFSGRPDITAGLLVLSFQTVSAASSNLGLQLLSQYVLIVPGTLKRSASGVVGVTVNSNPLLEISPTRRKGI